MARDTLLEAFLATQFSGPFGAAAIRASRAAPQVTDAGGTITDLLLGFAVTERRYSDGAALLRRAVAELAGTKPLPDDPLQSSLPMCMAASLLYDDSAWHELERRWVAELRDQGALTALLAALAFVAYHQLSEGRFADAEATAAEGRSLSEASGYRAHLGVFACADLEVLAMRGRELQARALAARLRPKFAKQGNGLGIGLVDQALTDLELGVGNCGDALRTVLEASSEQPVAQQHVAKLVEAGIRSGDREAAAAASAAFAPLALAAGRTGRWGCWPAAGPCSPPTRMRRQSTDAPSSTRSRPGWSPNWPGLAWCTVSGCVGNGAAGLGSWPEAVRAPSAGLMSTWSEAHGNPAFALPFRSLRDQSPLPRPLSFLWAYAPRVPGTQRPRLEFRFAEPSPAVGASCG